MNRIKHILLLNLLVLVCSICNAQNLKLGFQTGIGTYDMGDLKDFNASVFNSLPFKAKFISDYPAYFYYKPSLVVSFNKMDIGVLGILNSTGSRISSKDYSGEYRFDTKVRGLGPGFVMNYYLVSLKDKMKLKMYLEGGVLFSKLEIKEDFTFGGEEIENSSYTFQTVNYYTEPGLKLEYSLHPAIDLALNAGYCVHLDRETFESDTEGMLTFGPNWSGLRLGLSFIIHSPTEATE